STGNSVTRCRTPLYGSERSLGASGDLSRVLGWASAHVWPGQGARNFRLILVSGDGFTDLGTRCEIQGRAPGATGRMVSMIGGSNRMLSVEQTAEMLGRGDFHPDF